MFQLCFSNPTVARNVIVNANGSWPKDNFTVKNAADAGLPGEKSVIRDLRLCREKNQAVGCRKASPYLQAGTDGKPVGADLDAINAATAGAE
jgi:hypothetical protein